MQGWKLGESGICGGCVGRDAFPSVRQWLLFAVGVCTTRTRNISMPVRSAPLSALLQSPAVKCRPESPCAPALSLIHTPARPPLPPPSVPLAHAAVCHEPRPFAGKLCSPLGMRRGLTNFKLIFVNPNAPGPQSMSRRGDGARRACSAKRSVSWKSRKLPSGIHDDETALQVLESVELDDFRECKAGGIWGPLWPVDSPSIIIPPHNSDSDDWDSSPASSARRRGRTGGKWRTFSNSSALSRSDIAGSQGVSPACARSHLGAFVPALSATTDIRAQVLEQAQDKMEVVFCSST